MKKTTLESLRVSRGFKSLKTFCKHFEDVTGERLPEATLSGYELGRIRIGERRLDLFRKSLNLTSAEVRNLRKNLEKNKKPLRNVGPHVQHVIKKPGVKSANGYKSSKRPNTGERTRTSGAKKYAPKPTATRIGLAEASEYLILVKKLESVLGKKINDKEAKKLIFALALESTK